MYERVVRVNNRDNPNTVENNQFRDKIIESLNNIENGKGELLYKILMILEILPQNECQRVLDYLSELYLS